MTEYEEFIELLYANNWRYMSSGLMERENTIPHKTIFTTDKTYIFCQFIKILKAGDYCVICNREDDEDLAFNINEMLQEFNLKFYKYMKVLCNDKLRITFWPQNFKKDKLCGPTYQGVLDVFKEKTDT